MSPEEGAAMEVRGVEIGLVSTDRRLADFYAEVFDLEELQSHDYGRGVLYRFALGGVTLKINVPAEQPEPGPRIEPFTAATGFRYLSIFVSDLETAVERATSLGGRVRYGPMDSGNGQPHIVLEDPDGNTVEITQRR